jgi:putative aldouronate transport system permease protein
MSDMTATSRPTAYDAIIREQQTRSRFRRQLQRVWRYRELYLLLLPTLIFFLIFSYVPYGGLLMAFQDFSPRRGILGSPWVGLEHFQYLFGRASFYEILTNTLLISAYKLIFGMPVPIIFALLLNEVRAVYFKRITQTLTYFPHFLSWVVYGGLMVIFLAPGGAMTNMLQAFGLSDPKFLSNESTFRGLLVVTNILKEFGWNAIIYLAAITAIDPALYEAAMVDGANRWQQMRHITLPAIRGVIVILFILNLGHILDAGFEQVFVMYNPSVYSVAEIIDTYVYKIGLVSGRFSLATAVGLFKGVIGMVLILASNQILKRLDMPTIW